MQLRHDSLCAIVLRSIIAGICLPRLCSSERRGCLFISSVTDQAVYYAPLLGTLQQANNDKMSVTKLTASGQVMEPRGLAVDPVRKILYVMDTGIKALLAMRLQIMEDGKVVTFEPVEVMKDVAGFWVAVDTAGTVFYTDKHKIWSLEASAVQLKMDGSDQEESGTGDGTPHEPLYNDETIQQLNTPQGLAANGNLLFWANGANGQQDGVLVRGLQAPEAGNEASGLDQLAVNIDVGHGVCLSSSRVFYTAAEKEVYSTKIAGGAVVTVTDRLKKPQGCVWDGDGTIFVADEEGSKVYSFSGGGQNMGPRRIATALHLSGAFGVAVMQSGAFRPHLLGLAVLAVTFIFMTI